MLFQNILLSNEIPLNTQICLYVPYYKNYDKHYRYCYIIHFEIQYMHYKHTKSETHFRYPHYCKDDISFHLL